MVPGSAPASDQGAPGQTQQPEPPQLPQRSSQPFLDVPQIPKAGYEDVVTFASTFYLTDKGCVWSCSLWGVPNPSQHLSPGMHMEVTGKLPQKLHGEGAYGQHNVQEQKLLLGWMESTES